MSVAERETELVSGAFFRAASLPPRATTNITVWPSWASTPRFLVEPRSGYDWIRPVVEALRELGELEENWNDEGAPRINPDSALQALRFLTSVMAPSTASPSVVPTPTGGVQLEWHRGGFDVEVEFDPQAEPQMFIAERDKPERAWTGDLSRGLFKFASVQARLADRRASGAVFIGW